MGFVNVIKSTIEAAQSMPGMDARREAVELLPSPAKKLAARVINEIVFSFSQPVDELAIQAYGLQFIAQGGEALVVRQGNEVIKFVTSSELVTEKKREAMLATKSMLFGDVSAVMGSLLLPQVMSIDAHPYKRHARVVQTRQPFIAFEEVMKVTNNQLIVNEQSIEGYSQQLTHFVDDAWRLYDMSRLLPDTVGQNNLVLASDRLILLDTQPIGDDNRPLQDVIKGHLDVLAKKR